MFEHPLAPHQAEVPGAWRPERALVMLRSGALTVLAGHFGVDLFPLFSFAPHRDSMKRFWFAIVTVGGLLAAYMLLGEGPAPSLAVPDAPTALKSPGGTPTASAVPRKFDTPAPEQAPESVTTKPSGEPAPVVSSAEMDAPAAAVSERMLIAGDTIAGQCALGIMWNPDRFSDLLQSLRLEVADDEGVEAQRRAIIEAYREAFTLSGSGAELIDAACGTYLCAVNIRLPADTADDEVRDAMVGRLLGGIEVVGTQVSVASVDGASRETRRIFSVSEDVGRLGSQQCSE